MKKESIKYNVFTRIQRSFRLYLLKLFRTPGGARHVSLGFAIGFGLEMIVIPTASLAYLLFYPIVRLCRASLPAAAIGNIIGKLTFLPVLLMPLARHLGQWIYPVDTGKMDLKLVSFKDILRGNFQPLWHFLETALHVLIGMSVFGAVLGFVSYFVVYHLYEKQRQARFRKKCSTAC
jgi:uncharacterized protein (DUF2062 family)